MTTLQLRRRVLLPATVTMALALASGAAGGADPARELDAVQGRIRSLEREIGRAAAAKPTADKALKQAEVIEADARKALREVRQEMAEGRVRERTLRADMEHAAREVDANRAALEGQLRLAYISGRNEWLRVVLSQEDPLELTRRAAYFGYITRQRGALLHDLQQQMQSLEAAAAELRAHLDELAILVRRQEARVSELAASRQVRATALSTIQKDLRSKQGRLQRLRREARGLEQLMARLEKQSRDAARQGGAMPDTGPAQQTKGLPLRGRVIARYGQPRADGLLRWDGMVLAAPAGTEVRAVRGGRVVYADWLPGMGQLVVVDHGKGLMSLYGHNQELIRSTGATVRQGEVIARVGDSGGQSMPGLYFEVRRNGKPINPKDWVR